MDIDFANAEAVERMMSARPMLTGVSTAREAIPGMKDNLILHAGPPIEWGRMSGPLRGESRWEIDPAPGGSAVRLVTEGPLPRGLGILRPRAAAAARLALRADLKRLQSLVARGA